MITQDKDVDIWIVLKPSISNQGIHTSFVIAMLHMPIYVTHLKNFNNSTLILTYAPKALCNGWSVDPMITTLSMIKKHLNV